MINRLCPISVSFTKRVKPLISGIKSNPLFSIFFVKLLSIRCFLQFISRRLYQMHKKKTRARPGFFILLLARNKMPFLRTWLVFFLFHHLIFPILVFFVLVFF